MTRTRRIALAWILLAGGISIWWGSSIGQTAPNGMSDFKGVFYATRSLLLHADPYKEGEPLRAYLADGADRPMPADGTRGVLMRHVYLPTAFIFTAPFAMLPWGPALVLWTILGGGSLIFAAFLMWDTAAGYAPVISGVLICFILANTEVLFAIGNPAGIVVGLCVVAVWCFLKQRFVWVGILCLAASLAIKPHDTGFVWLYFLLAGGIHRKRALQTLLVTAVLGLAAILWVTPLAPHWMQELHSNLSSVSRTAGIAIDLQSVVSVFRDDPRIYNPVSYLGCGVLLLVWMVRTLRLQFSQRGAWLALAAAVPLTMLVTYHRPYDARLLLLAVPACAMLWAGGGPARWLALLVTSAGFVYTADLPLLILTILTGNLHISTTGLSGQILTVMLMRPTPLILLAMGIFYLWIYVRRDPASEVYSAV
jgi:hypothetical protein